MTTNEGGSYYEYQSIDLRKIHLDRLTIMKSSIEYLFVGYLKELIIISSTIKSLHCGKVTKFNFNNNKINKMLSKTSKNDNIKGVIKFTLSKAKKII